MSIHGVKAHEKEENDFSSKLSETCATSSKLRKSIRPVPMRRPPRAPAPKAIPVDLVDFGREFNSRWLLFTFFSFLIRHCFCLLIAVRGFFAPLIVRTPKKNTSTFHCRVFEKLRATHDSFKAQIVSKMLFFRENWFFWWSAQYFFSSFRIASIFRTSEDFFKNFHKKCCEVRSDWKASAGITKFQVLWGRMTECEGHIRNCHD